MRLKDYSICIIIYMAMAMLVFGLGIAIPCPINYVTGLYCPGCGITRACLSLIHGEIYTAFRYNPIVFIDVPVILIGNIFERIYSNNPKVKRKVNIVYIILLIITIIFGILRNIPQLSFLAPNQI